MSDTATPTAASAAAQVSAILKRVASTGSLPIMVTSPRSGMPRPRTAMISSNAVGIVPLLSPQYDGAIGAGLCGRRDSAGDVGLSRSCYDAQGKQLLPFAGSLI